MSVTEIVGSQENIIATIRAVKRGFSFISRSYNKVNVCFFTFGSLTIKKCAPFFAEFYLSFKLFALFSKLPKYLFSLHLR